MHFPPGLILQSNKRFQSVNFDSLSDCWLQMEHESFRDYNDWLAENGKAHIL